MKVVIEPLQSITSSGHIIPAFCSPQRESICIVRAPGPQCASVHRPWVLTGMASAWGVALLTSTIWNVVSGVFVA